MTTVAKFVIFRGFLPHLSINHPAFFEKITDCSKISILIGRYFAILIEIFTILIKEVSKQMTQERRPPLRLLQEEALARRLPKTHPLLPKILNSIGARKGGYRGEQDIDYHLTFLPQNKYTIFRGLRLIDQFAFQIDTVLLSTKLIFAIETKNYSGTLYFDKDSKQMIRRMDDVEEGFPNPLLQVQRQTHQLKNWLLQHKFPPIPIESLVTISQPKTILKSNQPEIFKKIFHTEHVVDKIISIEKGYSSHIVDEKGIRRISKMLVKEDTSLSNNILVVLGDHSTRDPHRCCLSCLSQDSDDQTF